MGKLGRQVVTGCAVLLVLTGPVANIVTNFREVRDLVV